MMNNCLSDLVIDGTAGLSSLQTPSARDDIALDKRKQLRSENIKIDNMAKHIGTYSV